MFGFSAGMIGRAIEVGCTKNCEVSLFYSPSASRGILHSSREKSDVLESTGRVFLGGGIMGGPMGCGANEAGTGGNAEVCAPAAARMAEIEGDAGDKVKPPGRQPCKGDIPDTRRCNGAPAAPGTAAAPRKPGGRVGGADEGTEEEY